VNPARDAHGTSTPPPAWRRRRWIWGVAGVIAAGAAAVILYLRLPRTTAPPELGRIVPRVRVEGVGIVDVGLVRDRGGVTDRAPTGFRPGDRFQIAVTCGEAGNVWADIVVLQPGRPGAPLVASYPSQPVRLTCGNQVPLPRAFTITGAGPASVCLALELDRAPTREPLGRRRGIACHQLVAE
jgi:hypothetical protein